MASSPHRLPWAEHEQRTTAVSGLPAAEAAVAASAAAVEAARLAGEGVTEALDAHVLAVVERNGLRDGRP